MKKFSFAMALFIGLGAGCCCTSGNKQQAKSLFNGRDLAGWVVVYGGEWNHVRSVTKGRLIQITWNGEPTIDYQTDRLTTGYIGLQNHDAKSVVKFRNIRITEVQ